MPDVAPSAGGALHTRGVRGAFGLVSGQRLADQLRARAASQGTGQRVGVLDGLAGTLGQVAEPRGRPAGPPGPGPQAAGPPRRRAARSGRGSSPSAPPGRTSAPPGPATGN